jgi:hypothetical protein
VADLIVPLISRRRERGQFAQKFQHGVPAVFLLFNGLRRLFEEPHGWSLAVGAAEVIVSVVVVGAFSRGLRALRQDTHQSPSTHHGPDWIDVFLGVLVAIEAWAHWHETGHVKRPMLFLAITLVVVGLNHGRLTAFIRRRRALRVSDTGISLPLRFFRRFEGTWAELVSMDVGPRIARIVRRDGREHSLNLDDLKNATEVRAALERGRQRLEVLAAPVTH